MNNLNEGERLAVVEQRVEDLRADIAVVKTDVKSILEALSSMSGGKRALFGLCTILGIVIAALGTIVTMIVTWGRSHP